MKLVSFVRNNELRLGVVTGDQRRVVDLANASTALKGKPQPAFASMLALIDAGPRGLDEARATMEMAQDQGLTGDCIHKLEDLHLAPPIMPPRMLCFSVYEGHMKQAFESVVTLKAGRVIGGIVKRCGLIKIPKGFFRKPIYYKGNNLSVIGHNDEVIWPRWTKMLDYEMELGVVIGKRGKNISANDAMPYVFGYTCFNDFSARDKMMQEIPWGGVGPLKGKDFDTGNAMGPWIVTADEIPDPYDLKIEVRVNGETRGSSSTSGMSHPISKMIEVATDEEVIVPGEFFGTGAATNGCGIEHLRFLEPDDVVEIEIERIGVLRNRVVVPQ